MIPPYIRDLFDRAWFGAPAMPRNLLQRYAQNALLDYLLGDDPETPQQPATSVNGHVPSYVDWRELESQRIASGEVVYRVTWECHHNPARTPNVPGHPTGRRWS